ncbi:cysteine desulfurase family protein [Candidatus Clavichlamydia salmonicola]|uniref:cysteine desulfurase family protein n=1 Tax=Candidatus Clavichlamydia salmonicola TaxID=469812 RepID=UPI001891BB93|nr:cysteine desulfurase family protein [Candidatus Clavichlamydia salmonicola]
MIYLDNNASTFLDPILKNYFNEIFFSLVNAPANPSSMHSAGRRGKAVLDIALQQVAHFFDCRVADVIFTSGATESINTLVHGISKGSIISSNTEHSCIRESLKIKKDKAIFLSPKQGYCVVHPEQVEQAITEDTKALIFSSVNGETGAKLDYKAIAKIALRHGLIFIIDATAMIGKEPFHLYPGVSACCFSGHKMHAPTGIGVVITTPGLRLKPLLYGGGQQRNRRSGTENVWGAVALGKILSSIQEKLSVIQQKMKTLRDFLEKLLKEHIIDMIIHCEDQERVCNVSNVSFEGVDGETLLMALDLDGLMVGHGSACASGIGARSHVLRSMGVSNDISDASIRFSLSRFTTEEELILAVKIVKENVERLRKLCGYQSKT